MVSYKLVAVQAFPKFGEKIAQDMLYWWGYKIHIYGHCSQEPIKMFSHFKDAAYCATYRDDGNPLVAGSEEDIYQPVIGQSVVVGKQLLRLQEAIGKEIDYQEELLEVLGMMDAIFATLDKLFLVGREQK